MIGEYFTVMDSFSNLDLEKTLADMGVEVHRWMNISHRNLHYPGEKNLNVRIHDLCTYEMGPTSTANIWAARCTVFAESDLVHKIQVGHTKEDIVAGLCQAVVGNYLNNVGKGKKIYSPVVFQGGVSKNIGVVKAFEKQLGCPVIVDENGHLMGAIGAAILARRNEKRASFDFSMEDMDFVTREVNCGRCPNNCEIICVYRNGELIDSWGKPLRTRRNFRECGENAEGTSLIQMIIFDLPPECGRADAERSGGFFSVAMILHQCFFDEIPVHIIAMRLGRCILHEIIRIIMHCCGFGWAF